MALLLHVRSPMKPSNPGDEPQGGPAAFSEFNIQRYRWYLHELSGLLTAVLINGQLLNEKLVGDPRQYYTQQVCEAAERGAAVIRELRAALHSTVSMHSSPRAKEQVTPEKSAPEVPGAVIEAEWMTQADVHVDVAL